MSNCSPAVSCNEADLLLANLPWDLLANVIEQLLTRGLTGQEVVAFILLRGGRQDLHTLRKSLKTEERVRKALGHKLGQICPSKVASIPNGNGLLTRNNAQNLSNLTGTDQRSSEPKNHIEHPNPSETLASRTEHQTAMSSAQTLLADRFVDSPNNASSNRSTLSDVDSSPDRAAITGTSPAADIQAQIAREKAGAQAASLAVAKQTQKDKVDQVASDAEAEQRSQRARCEESSFWLQGALAKDRSRQQWLGTLHPMVRDILPDSRYRIGDSDHHEFIAKLQQLVVEVPNLDWSKWHTYVAAAVDCTRAMVWRGRCDHPANYAVAMIRQMLLTQWRPGTDLEGWGGKKAAASAPVGVAV